LEHRIIYTPWQTICLYAKILLLCIIKAYLNLGADLAGAEFDQGKGMEKMALSVSESVLFEKPLPTPA